MHTFEFWTWTTMAICGLVSSKLLSGRTKLVAFPHVSNVLGLLNPVKEICERAHRAGSLVHPENRRTGTTVLSCFFVVQV